MPDPDVVVKPRDVMPAGARTLPAAFYTDAAYVERELDALFRTMWIGAGRAEEVERPGQFVLRDLAGDSVIITWKLIIQNYNECLHCPHLHPAPRPGPQP